MAETSLLEAQGIDLQYYTAGYMGAYE